MKLTAKSELIRYSGRWGASGAAMAATACGSYFEIGFTGNLLTLSFDCTYSESPYPHLYISVDGGARIEAPLSPWLRVSAAGEGKHTAKVLMKSAMEMQHRWHQPLVGKVALLEAEAEGFYALEPDLRKTVEFIGDSITEGVLIDVDCKVNLVDQRNRPYQDDVTATYAYLTAEALGLRPLFMGYGAVGATKGGCGGVPDVVTAYPYCFSGAPAKIGHPEYTVINHGANDRGASPEEYVKCYRRLLDVVFETHPATRVFAVVAFRTTDEQADALGRMIAEYKAETGRDVHYIDSRPFSPDGPLHPLRDGHEIIAKGLTEALRPLL